MKQRSLFILSCTILSLGLGANAYLFQERNKLSHTIDVSHKTMEKKRSMIHVAKNNSSSTSTILHRLSLPSGRIQAGEEFQILSHQLLLQGLDFQISPETDLDNSLSPINFSESVVELKFNHNHDAPIYQMIQQIIHNFPGLVYPCEIVIWRNTDAPTPSLHGHFKFQWLKTKTEDLEG